MFEDYILVREQSLIRIPQIFGQAHVFSTNPGELISQGCFFPISSHGNLILNNLPSAQRTQGIEFLNVIECFEPINVIQNHVISLHYEWECASTNGQIDETTFLEFEQKKSLIQVS